MPRKSKTHNKTANRTPLLIIGMIGILIAIVMVISAVGQITPISPQSVSRLELDPILGDANAPVTIIEYGAYACSACRAWHQAGIIDNILEAYPNQVRFIFRDFPVISPNYDRMAAQIAQCALDQDQAKFWAYHDALYTQVNPNNSQGDLLALGESVGLDVTALRTCYEAGIHRQTVQYDEQRARELGLPGTPAFLINGARIFNATPEILLTEIEKALNN